MKKTILTYLILFACLTFGFGQETKVVLDSIYGYNAVNNHFSFWYVTSKYYYEYDNCGNKITENYWYQNSSDNWFIIKSEFDYNKQGLVDTITISGWNSIQDTWGNKNRTIYTFTKKGLLTEEVQQKWNPGFELWENKKLIKTTYNDNGDWIGVFMNDNFRNIRTFENDLLIESVFENKENETWLITTKTNFVYDNDKNLIKQIDIGENPFAYESEIHYSYNAQGSRILSTFYDVDFGNLILIGKDSFVYNTNNYLIEDYSFFWQNNQWKWGKWRHLYNYDVNGNLENYIIQKRNNENYPWQNHSDKLTIYNNNSQILDDYNYRNWDTINAVWEGGRWTNYIYNQNDLEEERITHTWNYHTDDFTDKYTKFTNYYSEKEIDTNDLSIDENCPFLNPYLPFTTVYCDYWELEKTYQLQVFSIDGRFVFNTEFIGCEGFRVDKHLDRGWYVFVVLEDGKILQKQKILIF